MEIKIPYELKLMLLSYEGLEISTETIKYPLFGSEVDWSFPGRINIKLNLFNKPDLLLFCKQWMDKIYNLYTEHTVDIGCYIGLFPIEIKNEVVCFSVDYFDPNRKDWKDWFILEDYNYAS